MSQITRWPVEVFCQRMSALPSPLKSPEPAMLHDVPTVPKLTKDSNVVPFMIQITRWPVELFCQSTSALPSPLKSLFGEPQGTAAALNLPIFVAQEAPLVATKYSLACQNVMPSEGSIVTI